MNALYFEGKTGGHSHLAASVFFCRLRNSILVGGGNLTVTCNNSNIEYIGIALVPKTA